MLNFNAKNDDLNLKKSLHIENDKNINKKKPLRQFMFFCFMFRICEIIQINENPILFFFVKNIKLPTLDLHHHHTFVHPNVVAMHPNPHIALMRFANLLQMAFQLAVELIHLKMVSLN